MKGSLQMLPNREVDLKDFALILTQMDMMIKCPLFQKKYANGEREKYILQKVFCERQEDQYKGRWRNLKKVDLESSCITQ